MRKSQIQAMARLVAANPLHDIDAMSQWTQADEDVLLAFLLADDDGSSEEVPSFEYNSHRSTSASRMRRLKHPALLAVAAVVVGAVALAVDLTGSGAPSAFAAWTATTTTPPASQLASADASCSRFYAPMLKAWPPDFPSSLPPLTLTDSRGPFELLLYSDPSWFFACLWGHGSAISLAWNGGPEAPASPHSIGVPQVPFDRNADGSGYTMAYGYVGARVKAVTLHLTDGTNVEATVQNGFYAAWWPVRTDVASAEVSTSAGVLHQDFGDVGPNNAGPAQVEQ